MLVVQTREPRHFDRREIEIFQTCAQLIAPVVINARLLSLVNESEEDVARSQHELALHGIRVRSETPRAARSSKLRGIATSPGIAIGRVHRLENPLVLANLDYQPNPDPVREEQDLVRALQERAAPSTTRRVEVGDRFGPDFSAVFHTHIQILEDKGFVSKLREELARDGNAHVALRNVRTPTAHLRRVEDPYFRDRIADVEDVGRRVMEQLLGERHRTPALEEGAIIVTDNILPSHFARLELDKVAAIVSEHGGPTSHGAILARTLEIPAVTGVPRLLASVTPGEIVIVDGGEGQVLLGPDERLIAEYERAKL